MKQLLIYIQGGRLHDWCIRSMSVCQCLRFSQLWMFKYRNNVSIFKFVFLAPTGAQEVLILVHSSIHIKFVQRSQSSSS